jgi:hypothetical protein
MPDMQDETPRRAGLERFRNLEGEGGVPLDSSNAPLAPADSAEWPFLRCAQCGMDAHRSARTCEMCGADLRTPEQERFNRELHGKLREENEALARETAELARRQAASVPVPGSRLPPGAYDRRMDPDLVPELLAPGGLERATGRLLLDLVLRAIGAVPAVVWIGLGVVLLGAVAYAKTRGGFGIAQLLLTGLLAVPIVTGILVGRPLRRGPTVPRGSSPP